DGKHAGEIWRWSLSQKRLATHHVVNGLGDIGYIKPDIGFSFFSYVGGLARPYSRHFSTSATSSQTRSRRVRTACGCSLGAGRSSPWGPRSTNSLQISRWRAMLPGVHFRSDSIRGLRLGEEVAIGLLADTSRTYNEKFDGF